MKLHAVIPSPLVAALIVGIATLGALPTAEAAPEPMTPDEIVALAETGVGYSYWWGGACWTTPLTEPGSCVGNCPDCTHGGSWGADCSGFVGKVWQVPGPVALETCSHPYATLHFRWDTTHWQPVPWEDAARADSFVYRNDANTGGHVFLYESGDPWGSAWAYECRGCADGCVKNVRSISTAYIAIRRDRLVGEPVAPTEGTLRGVVFVDRGQGTADMTERVPGAAVAVLDADVAPATADEDGGWSFALPPGDWTVRATAADHAPGERTCTVVAGETAWCSVGVTPDCTPDCAGLECGPDPICGASCGTCAAGQACQAGRCGCTPDCADRDCGPDPVCGASCGACPDGAPCEDGVCGCVPACGERECGPDPDCGASCGACPDGWTCTADGRCACTPDCADRDCGLDPACGTTCGACAADETCTADGRCAPAHGCAAACADRSCGPDPACGVWCGRCGPTEACAGGRCVPYGDDVGKLYGQVVRPADGGGVVPCGDLEVLLNDQSVARTDPEGWYEVIVTPGAFRVSATWEGTGGEGLGGEGLGDAVTCTAVGGQATECSLALGETADDGGRDDGGGAGPGDAPDGPRGLAPDDGGSGCAAGGAATAPLPLALLLLLLLSLSRFRLLRRLASGRR